MTTPEQQAATFTAWPGRMPAPVFIVGSMGSGSTLLRLILDSHENIAIPQETSFMRLVTAHRSVPFWRFGPDWFRRLELTPEDLDVELVRFYSGLFERYARRHGKQRWGEKTPNHVWHMSEMARLFPDAVFVGIVRHPGGTAGSLVKRFGSEAGRGVNHWVRMNRAMLAQACRLGDRFVLVRYEDLVTDTEAVLRELLDLLGEPWSPRVLEHHVTQREQGAPKVVEGQTRSRDAVDRDRVGRWMTELSADDRAVLRDRASGWAELFGYDVDNALPKGGLVPGGPDSRLATGSALAQRREQFRGRLSFREPERPAVEGTYPHTMWKALVDASSSPGGRRTARLAAVAERLPGRARRPLLGLRRSVRRRLARARRPG